MSGKNFLLRRHLCERLAEYYSQSADRVVGSLAPGAAKLTTRANAPRSIDFASLFNEWHWKRKYKQVYEAQEGMWLTPVELFYPYYSNILANFVSESMTTAANNLGDGRRGGDGNDDGTFEVVELGGGRGTNAIALLDHLRECHPDAYDGLRRYSIYDASPTLHELQRKVLVDGSRHAEKVELVHVDLMEVAEGRRPFLTPSSTPTVMIALETNDNLPHDKLARCIETNEILQAEVGPAVPIDFDAADAGGGVLQLDTSRAYVETFAPTDDPLLRRILSVAPSLYAPTISQGPRWVPSVALGMLMKLFECRPNSSVLLADFDWLPPPDLRGASAFTRRDGEGEGDRPSAMPAMGDPLVTDMDGNDHQCYLTSPPGALCDILFPTDFGRLAAFAGLARDSVVKSRGKSKALPVSALAMKQSEFLIRYGAEDVNKTKGWSGYSPLIHDFGNCSVLAVTP